MKDLSICSGIEAASVAWHPLGWEPLAFSEIEPFPCAVLAHHWPHVPNLGDMTKHENWPTDIRPDLIVGGTPCQAFSVAGLRQGLADPRGNLTLVFLAILAQYRPQWVVWENVPGVLSDKTGAFGAFLGGLGELGYGFAYRVLDAQYFGVAQRRRRVFIVASLGGWGRAAAVLFERESMLWHPAPSRKEGKGVATGAKTGLEPIFLDRATFNQGENAQFDPVIRQDGISDALVARGPHAVASRMVAFGEYVEDGTASTLKMRDYKDATDLVATTQYGPVAGSLTARHDSSPCADRGQNIVCVHGTQDPCSDERVAFALGRNSGQENVVAIHDMATRHAGTNGSGADVGKGHGLGVSKPNDPMFTLTKGDVHAVAFKPGQSAAARSIGAQEEIACTLEAGGGGNNKQGVAYGIDEEQNGAKELMGCLKARTKGGGFEAAVATPYAVRRLTPTECERLQGFPDGHSMIPWRNKPASECPDGPRYKALGNSMAVPVMRWIGERIAHIETLIQP